MKFWEEFEKRLEERYYKLYGTTNCGQWIKKEKQKFLFKGMGILFLLCISIAAGGVKGVEYYENLTLNQKGEIVEVRRPDAEQGALSFSVNVKMRSEQGEREKKYFITIEPAGDGQREESGEILPEQSREERAEDELSQLISGLNADTTQNSVILPQKLDTGERLTWEKADDSNLAVCFVTGMLMLWLLYKSRFYKIEREEKKAKAAIIRELPEFINKIVLLMNAGVVLHTAFIKIVDDYNSNRSRANYFYLQLNQICKAVRETNASLCQELQQFAKRSGVKELIRTANIITDNISKGADLSDKLKRENELLWFARKQQSEEKGRLAETKLTLPLMILLMVLIMVTIAPAMMEI